MSSNEQRQQESGQQAERQSEGYPAHWKHCTIHLDPTKGQMHSDGDHSVREWIESRIRALEAERDEARRVVAAVSEVVCGKAQFNGDLAQYVRNEVEGRRQAEEEIERIGELLEQDESDTVEEAAKRIMEDRKEAWELYADALAERDEAVQREHRFKAGIIGAVPQTYGEARLAYGDLPCEPHEWDNRTTAENVAWVIRAFRDERDEARHQLQEAQQRAAVEARRHEQRHSKLKPRELLKRCEVCARAWIDQVGGASACPWCMKKEDTKALKQQLQEAQQQVERMRDGLCDMVSNTVVYGEAAGEKASELLAALPSPSEGEQAESQPAEQDEAEPTPPKPTPPEGWRLKYDEPRVPEVGESFLAATGANPTPNVNGAILTQSLSNYRNGVLFDHPRWIVERVEREPAPAAPVEQEDEPAPDHFWVGDLPAHFPDHWVNKLGLTPYIICAASEYGDAIAVAITKSRAEEIAEALNQSIAQPNPPAPHPVPDELYEAAKFARDWIAATPVDDLPKGWGHVNDALNEALSRATPVPDELYEAAKRAMDWCLLPMFDYAEKYRRGPEAQEEIGNLLKQALSRATPARPEQVVRAEALYHAHSLASGYVKECKRDIDRLVKLGDWNGAALYKQRMNAAQLVAHRIASLRGFPAERASHPHPEQAEVNHED